MFVILERELEGWSKRDGMVRWMAQTINLSTEKILLSLKMEANIPEAILAEPDAGVPNSEVLAAGVLKLSRKILSKIGYCIGGFGN